MIGPADNETDDSKCPPCVSDLVSGRTTRGSLLCELQRDDNGFVCISARLLGKGSLDDFQLSMLKGYTTCSDKEL